MTRFLLTVSCALCLSALPSRAAADILLTPFAGVTFVDEADVRKLNYGATVGFGSLIGFEVDVSRTELGSFDDIPVIRLTADATTLMGNLVIRVPAGPVQPYVSGGAGLIRVSGNVNVPFLGNLVGASADDLGMNVGGGLYLFPARNIGIRGDVRYFRSLSDLSLDSIRDIDGIDDLPLPNVDFWRVTGGVTIRF